ncbi:hypothetical protein BaRGS_00001950, partial [Batillaria attramentaria]
MACHCSRNPPSPICLQRENRQSANISPSHHSSVGSSISYSSLPSKCSEAQPGLGAFLRE